MTVRRRNKDERKPEKKRRKEEREERTEGKKKGRPGKLRQLLDLPVETKGAKMDGWMDRAAWKQWKRINVMLASCFCSYTAKGTEKQEGVEA